jgi:regulator of protease activity HflC (stomatin/prohibitin superfamily)
LYGKSETFYDNVEGSILNTRVLNAYREEARKFSTDSLINNVANYESAVQARLMKEFQDKYFLLSEITSNLIPPPSMKLAIEARNNQIQEAAKLANAKQTRENQIAIDVMNIEAEAKIKIITAEAEVKAAKLDNEARQIRNQSLTGPELERMKIEKWNGEYPATLVINGNSSQMISLPASK